MTAVNQVQSTGETLAIEIDSVFRKLAAVSIFGSSATLFCGLTYGVVQLCYYWPILQSKLVAIQSA